MCICGCLDNNIHDDDRTISFTQYFSALLLLTVIVLHHVLIIYIYTTDIVADV